MIKVKLNFFKYAAVAIVGWYVLYLLAVGLISSPSGDPYKPQALTSENTDADRAAVLAEGVVHALQDTLDSSFGS